MRRDTQWLAQRVGQHTGNGGDGVAVHRLDDPGVELHVPGRDIDIGAGLRDRLARVAALDVGELVAVAQQQIAESAQHPGAIARSEAGPGPVVEGPTRSRHGSVDVGCGGGTHLRQRGAGSWVDDRETRVVVEVDTVDERRRVDLRRCIWHDLWLPFGVLQPSAQGLAHCRSGRSKPNVRP